jgi:hypothetical protein
LDNRVEFDEKQARKGATNRSPLLFDIAADDGDSGQAIAMGRRRSAGLPPLR